MMNGDKPRTIAGLYEWTSTRFDRLSRLLVRALLAAVLVGAGMLGGLGLFVNNARHETDRVCTTLDKTINEVVDVFLVKIPATRRASLPKRTPEEQAQYAAIQKQTREGIDEALKECGK